MDFVPEGASQALARIAEIEARFGWQNFLAGSPAAPSAPAGSGGFSDAIAQAAAKNGLPSSLVAAVVQAESGGNPTAISPKGAIGLMQLMPETARSLGISNPFDPMANLEGGSRFLKGMLDQFGDLPEALAAYNAGPNAVAHHKGIPPFPETQRYVNHVMDLYRQNQANSPH